MLHILQIRSFKKLFILMFIISLNLENQTKSNMEKLLPCKLPLHIACILIKENLKENTILLTPWAVCTKIQVTLS